MAAVTPFVSIDILDAAGNRLGTGPLTSVASLTLESSLDMIGGAEFSLPAADRRAALLQPGVQFDIHTQYGYAGRFAYQRMTLDEGAGETPMITVACRDALQELAWRTVGFRREYYYQPVDDVVADLLSVLDGWTVEAESGIGHTTVTYEGESVMAALDEMRDRWGRHFRLGTGKTLQFGAFGDAAPVRITNLQMTTRLAPGIAVPDSVSLVEESSEVYNRIIPLGAGHGTVQLTIEHADLGSYAVQTGTNADGSLYYYIEDAASAAAYGVRTRVAAMPGIRPINNSEASIRNAANALKLAAEQYLARHKAPQVTYRVRVAGAHLGLKVGQLVRLDFVGVVEGYSYRSIHDEFYIMDIRRHLRHDGSDLTTLDISTVDARRTSDQDVMLDIMHDLNALKVHVPISLAYLKANESTRMDDATPATMSIRIKDEVLALNRALLRFRTSPLKSSVKSLAASAAVVGSTAAGGGVSTSSAGGGDHHHDLFEFLSTSGSSPSTVYLYNAYVRRSGAGDLLAGLYLQTPAAASNWQAIRTFSASGDHTHDITIPAHSHDITIPEHNHAFDYGIYEDDQVPTGITLAVNGVDVTAALGGPWGDPADPEAQDIEIDITQYLTGASGGLRQNHTLTFTCTGGQGELTTEVDLLVSVQAIAVT